MTALLLLLVAAVFVSSGPQPTPIEPVVAPPPVPSELEVLEIVLQPAAVVPGHRWGAETAGHVTLLFDTVLADLEGVVPRVPGAPQAPAVALALPGLGSPWTLGLEASLLGEALGVRATLCDPEGECTVHQATGNRLQPNAPVANVTREIATRLGRRATIDLATWDLPETSDSYAALLLGRAGAVMYGLMDGVEPRFRGDVRRDPLVRAAYLDPGMATAWTVVVRTSDDPNKRYDAAQLALRDAPTSLARAADQAALLVQLGRPDQAWAEWQAVAARAPQDPRFVLARARSALANEDARMARAVLGELQPRYGEMPEVVALQVAVSDALDGTTDTLLQRWQEVATSDPAPVRRRIERYVDEGRLEDALALTNELALRGALAESQRLKLALANDLGRFAEAADAARGLGAEDVARRMQAAATGEGHADRVALLAGATSAEGQLAYARAVLGTGDADAALGIARRLLADDPWWPEALDVASRALSALGRVEEAASTRERLLFADPMYFERPR